MPVEVRVGSPLRSYTSGQAVVQAECDGHVSAVLAELDQRYPGIRFRMVDEQDCIRQHIRMFVNNEPAHNLKARIHDGDTLHLIGALSGG